MIKTAAIPSFKGLITIRKQEDVNVQAGKDSQDSEKINSIQYTTTPRQDHVDLTMLGLSINTLEKGDLGKIKLTARECSQDEFIGEEVLKVPDQGFVAIKGDKMYILANSPEGCLVEKVINLKELTGNLYENAVKNVTKLFNHLIKQAYLYEFENK